VPPRPARALLPPVADVPPRPADPPLLLPARAPLLPPVAPSPP